MNNELFKWDNSFSCNSVVIDEQHKILIGLINKLYFSMTLGKSKAVMNEILEELIKYTSYHFNTEESFYISIDNEFVKQHLDEHNKFIEQVTLFKTDFDNGKVEVSIELMRFLRNWTKTHILGFDKKSSIYFV